MIRSGRQVDLIGRCANGGFNPDDVICAPRTISAGIASDRANSTEETIRSWSSRLAMARSALPGIFNRLVNELPRVKTPWERILRDLLFRHSRRKRRTDPSRPTRRWLALEGDLKSVKESIFLLNAG
jgi:hypothetical protein